MYIFEKIAETFKKDTFINILNELFNEQEINELYTNFITDRLANEGKDKDGITLSTDNSPSGQSGFYSRFTERSKSERQGLSAKTSNVTLYDTGDFYNSIKLTVNKEFYNLQAEFNKNDGHMSKNFMAIYDNQKDFESAILGLDTVEQRILLNILKPKLIQRFKNV